MFSTPIANAGTVMPSEMMAIFALPATPPSPRKDTPTWAILKRPMSRCPVIVNSLLLPEASVTE